MAKIRVELVDNMGSDLTVVNAARVSFDKESEWAEAKECTCGAEDEFECTCGSDAWVAGLQKGDKKLVSYLAKHGHFTPFTHPQITLRETVPIFVARQRFKHVVGFTYNEVSRRYVADEPEFYTPDVWRSKPEGSIKQGSGTETVITMSNPIPSCQNDEFCCGETDSMSNTYEEYTDLAQEMYSNMLKAGVAPEQARMVLPQSMMTSYYVTGSLQAFARMVKQRKDAHAQKEIQDLAKLVEDIIRPLYPVSWSALVD